MSEVPDEASSISHNTGLGLGSDIPLGGHLPQSAQNQTSPDMSNFADGSWRIFSMYLERAKEEDEKITESWQADANGILVFVRSSPDTVLHTNSPFIDRLILRFCRIVALGVNSRHSAESTGYLQLLPRRYLSSKCCQLKSVQCFKFPSGLPTVIFSTHICHMGELALVLELGDQSYLCSTRDLTTAVGPKIPQGHSDTLQSTQTS